MARSAPFDRIKTRTARLKLAQRREPYWTVIAEGCALGYRRGAKAGTWVARWRDGDGKQHYEALGPADDYTEGAAVLTSYQAQEKAREWFDRMARAENGPAEGPITVQQACERYLDYLLAEKGISAAKDAALRLRKHVAPRLEIPEKIAARMRASKIPTDDPKLGNRLVVELRLRELEQWRNELVEDAEDEDEARRAKDTANRLLGYLKAALNRLMLDHKSGITNDHAWRFLKPFKGVGAARQVHLDPEQIGRLINVTSGNFRQLVIGLLLTGARPPAGELAQVRARDFSLATGTLHIADSKTGPRDVVLTKEGIRFFKDATAGLHPDALIFAREDGTTWHKDYHSRLIAAAVDAAKLPEDTCMYSLRHTYASQSLMAGMNIKLLAENMGTSVRMIEQHYGKFIKAAQRQQIEASAPRLGLKAGNVVPLRAAGAR